MVADEFSDIGRASVEGEEIILEDLDAVEARPGDRLELLREFAADRDSRNRGPHVKALPISVGERAPNTTMRSRKPLATIMANVVRNSNSVSYDKFSYDLEKLC
ncbi:hypothetical protein A4U53_040895 (plasmid) [Rhizobium ruizarguesonis]|uniref:Uncharacterized protein n=1 Tax=Rhizobium ruizarguesonis TaxID=2081791 RepID=A0ACD5EY91_9HYPH